MHRADRVIREVEDEGQDEEVDGGGGVQTREDECGPRQHVDIAEGLVVLTADRRHRRHDREHEQNPSKRSEEVALPVAALPYREGVELVSGRHDNPVKQEEEEDPPPHDPVVLNRALVRDPDDNVPEGRACREEEHEREVVLQHVPQRPRVDHVVAHGVGQALIIRIDRAHPLAHVHHARVGKRVAEGLRAPEKQVRQHLPETQSEQRGDNIHRHRAQR
mmetsp:Transcript_20322/g.49094  ORF Transcript_20322/g.49094 Transcript_20322/m.49094 type:complete len:219 (-) Transcript_20322:713-1369(-)